MKVIVVTCLSDFPVFFDVQLTDRLNAASSYTCRLGEKIASTQTKQCKIKGQRTLTKHCEATQTPLLVNNALLVGCGKDPPTLAQVAG